MSVGAMLYFGSRIESSPSNTLVLWARAHSAMRCLSARLPYRPHIRAIYFAAFFCAAQRFRCASAIRLRASGLKIRLVFTGLVADFLPRLLVTIPVSRAWACSMRAISASIAERTSFSLMRDCVPGVGRISFRSTGERAMTCTRSD